MIPLLFIFLALAAATAWYVAIPAFAKEPQTRRACEVVVLQTGATKCVKTPASRAAAHKPKPAKH